MSTRESLTLIAISLIVLALVGIAGLAILWQVAKRLMVMENTVVKEIGELRSELQGIIRHARDTSQQVSETLQQVRRGAYNVGLVVSGLASWAFTRKRLRQSTASETEVQPWWITGASLAWSLLQRSRKKKSSSAKSQGKSVGL